MPLMDEAEVNLKRRRKAFLNTYRLGIDFGERAHGVAVAHGNSIPLAATLIDPNESDLEKRGQLRHARRTRDSRMQRLARFRQWCLRHELPDPDPFKNHDFAQYLWPLDKTAQLSIGQQASPCKTWLKEFGRPRSAARRRAGRVLRYPFEHWEEFRRLPADVQEQIALVNPFVARKLAREGNARPIIFVRALWHLMEHRGFDWHRRKRDDDLASGVWDTKLNFLKYLKTLVLDDKAEQDLWRRIRERDSERTKARPWADDDEIRRRIAEARARFDKRPEQRGLNPPRDYVENEIKECLASLPAIQFRNQRGNARTPSPDEVYRSLLKIVNWNRREPRFDNRQLRGCTWCAAQGTHVNTPRKRGQRVASLLIKAALRDIRVADRDAAAEAESQIKTRGRATTRAMRQILSAERALEPSEFDTLYELCASPQLDTEQLKVALCEFFAQFAHLPRRQFLEEGKRKKLTLKDPYQWHTAELLNLGSAYRNPPGVKGRSRLCMDHLRERAEKGTTKEEYIRRYEAALSEGIVNLSQRQLRARCDRLLHWIDENVRAKYDVRYIRIEAVLPRPGEKARKKAQSAASSVDQLPKHKLKIRLMEELGARCTECNKPYKGRFRRADNIDKRFCQCPQPAAPAFPTIHAPCAYCLCRRDAEKKFYSPDELHIEHIYPRNARIGFGPNAEFNKTIACSQCNDAKDDRLPFQFFGVGTDAWRAWKRLAEAHFRGAKKQIALLEEYELPEDLDQTALAHTSLVHRYLKQQLARRFFPAQAGLLWPQKTDPRASLEARNEAKRFIHDRIAMPAGWLTSQCRLDWEHEGEGRDAKPLVPRKSPLRIAEEREKDLQDRLAATTDQKRRADITRSFDARGPVEDSLRTFDYAVCDRSDLNHNWIDAAVLASIPPYALNIPQESADQLRDFERYCGDLFDRIERDGQTQTLASATLAPRAADFYKENRDGRVVALLEGRTLRETRKQQMETLYGSRIKRLLPVGKDDALEEKEGFRTYIPIAQLQAQDWPYIITPNLRNAFRALCEKYTVTGRHTLSDEQAVELKDHHGESIRHLRILDTGVTDDSLEIPGLLATGDSHPLRQSLSARGLRKPRRIVKMRTPNAEAVLCRKVSANGRVSFYWHISPNPWRAVVEGKEPEPVNGIGVVLRRQMRVWLPASTKDPVRSSVGFYRITKLLTNGAVQGVPAWADRLDTGEEIQNPKIRNILPGYVAELLAAGEINNKILNAAAVRVANSETASAIAAA